MASPPTPQMLLGPFYFGALFNTFLYGVLIVQVIYYFQGYKKDKTWLRLFVLYLFVVETVNTAMCMGIVYEPLVGQFGTDKPMSVFPSLLPAQPILEVAVFVPVQLFYAWRIRIIMRNYLAPAVICMSSLASMVSAIWTTVLVAQVKIYLKKPQVDTTALIWSCTAAGADIVITGSLIWSLRTRKTGIRSTDDIIERIIRNAIQTGAITVAFTLLNSTLFVGLSNSTLSTFLLALYPTADLMMDSDFVFDFAIPKLYSNALVSTLNARTGTTDGGMMELRGTRATPQNPLTLSGSSRTGQTGSSGTHVVSTGDVVFARNSNHDLFLETKSDILALGTSNDHDNVSYFGNK
ncbi:MFS domain-containing protein [Favolaschia claudopus]|uniref:MFS domain-containing protein n=1 Tax=Favolaschia claudopus TaxID=2862362 RepID=A0AAW0DII2_9AGAR